VPESKLPDRLQALVQLICDVRMMQKTVMEIGYDPEKIPLGKLSKSTISKGMDMLKQIEACLKSKAAHSTLAELSSRFYSLIPHKTYGMRPPPVINSMDMLKEKLELCESLADIQIAMSLLSSGGSSENPIDSNYAKLKCDMEPVDKKSKEWQIVQQYVKNTHGSTHTTYDLEIEDLFRVQREGEEYRFKAFESTPNRMLLWHGSRLTNFVGILSQGLRIAPPEAPVTGYMFGKGVYFADMVSKSANYCFTNRDNNTGVMLLCEVALGKTNDLLHADYNANLLPPGTLSTKGCGKNVPDPKGFVRLDDGVIVPAGKQVDAGIPGSSLLYNEFIVYNTSQVKMRYLVRMKFKYH